MDGRKERKVGICIVARGLQSRCFVLRVVGVESRS